jgi:hypothetical protein
MVYLCMETLPQEFLEVLEDEKDTPTRTRNPFTFSLIIPAVKVQTSAKFYKRADLSTEDGIHVPKNGTLSTTDLQNEYLVDASMATSVFRDSGVSELVMGLEGNALKLFTCIVMRLGFNKDRIRLKADDYTALMDVTRKTFYKSVALLIRYNFIARDAKNTYWINPAIFFNGNRLAKYPDRCEVRAIVPRKKSEA